MDMREEVREALETATKAVNAVTDPTVKPALITLLDAVSQVARVIGVPNAVEPQTGKPRVTTE